jgi:hypothetical protein
MRWLWLAIGLVGCSGSYVDKLEGRWFGESLVNVQTDQLAQATAWARGTSFEFSGSHVTVTIPTEMPRVAPFEVVEGRDQDVTIAVLRPDGQRDIARFQLVEPGVMRWDIGERRAIVMRRSEF